MRLLYEASNNIEAHMILNLLEQAGLSGRIDGEFLQGGVGELQAIGIARVMVEESDYSEAKKIVQAWDAKQPVEAEKPVPRKNSWAGSGVLGFVLGAGLMLAYYQTPITDDGIDYNGDGKLDEKWTYVNYRVSNARLDRNLDGNIDLVFTYDRRGLIENASSDDDFNGSFETDTSYKNGNAVVQRSDTTGDGFKDYIMHFKHGVAYSVSFINPNTAKAIKTQKFGPFGLLSAEFDSTGDGVMDTFYEYDALEELVERSVSGGE